MALMAETGYLGMEKPDFAIFADTGWEPPAVYENVEWLKGKTVLPHTRRLQRQYPDEHARRV